MKRLLTACFMLLTLVAGGSAQQPRALPNSDGQALNPAATSPQPQVRVAPLSDLSNEQLTQLLQRRALNRDGGDPAGLCYTMRSFVFERYNGGDAVRLVRQRTCTRASQFRAKQATVTVTNPR